VSPELNCSVTFCSEKGVKSCKAQSESEYPPSRISLFTLQDLTLFLCNRTEIGESLGDIDVATVSRAVRDNAVLDDPMWEVISQQIYFALCKT